MNWLKILFRGKSMEEKAKTQLDESSNRVMDSVLSAGTLMYLRGAFEEALPWLETALESSLNDRNKELEGVVRTRLAWLLADLGRAPEAFQHANKALPLVRKYQQKEVETDTLLLLGALYTGRGDLAEAIKHYQDSVKLTRKLIAQKGSTIGLRANELNGITSLASLYTRTGEIEQAFGWIEEGQEIAKEVEVFWQNGGQPGNVSRQASLMARKAGMYHLVRSDVLFSIGDKNNAKNEAQVALRIGQDDQDDFLVRSAIDLLRRLG